jgi:hypothetical protein
MSATTYIREGDILRIKSSKDQWFPVVVVNFATANGYIYAELKYKKNTYYDTLYDKTFDSEWVFVNRRMNAFVQRQVEKKIMQKKRFSYEVFIVYLFMIALAVCYKHRILDMVNTVKMRMPYITL